MANLKLTIHSSNEAKGYNSEGKVNSINMSCDYHVLTEDGENIGSANMSASYSLNGNITTEMYSEALQALTDKIHNAFEQFKNAIVTTNENII